MDKTGSPPPIARVRQQPNGSEPLLATDVDRQPDWKGISILVLASGLSKRFGSRDKLLRELGGRPLAGHIARTIRSLSPAHTIAVVNNEAVAELFEDFDIVFNQAPEMGLGHSLQLAARASANPSVLVCLADMPFVTGEMLEQLRERHQAGSLIVATRSDVYRGPPCIFPRADLLHLHLNGDAGARELLQGADWIAAHSSRVRDYDFEHDFPNQD